MVNDPATADVAVQGPLVGTQLPLTQVRPLVIPPPATPSAQSTEPTGHTGQGGISQPGSAPQSKRRKVASAAQAGTPHTATTSCTSRKKPFCKQELDFLVDYVRGHSRDMLVGANSQTTAAQRDTHWKHVAEHVSSFGHEVRTAQECKKRWNDIKRSTKAKRASNYNLTLVTGGGPAPEEEVLTPHESLVVEFMPSESVEGVGEMPDFDAQSSEC